MKLIMENWKRFLKESVMSGNGPLAEPAYRDDDLDEGVADDIAAVIEYAVQKGLKDGMHPEEAAQIFADIQGEGSYAEEDVEAAYENWERYDLGGVDPDDYEYAL